METNKSTNPDFTRLRDEAARLLGVKQNPERGATSDSKPGSQSSP
jgi:hypothetical protein